MDDSISYVKLNYKINLFKGNLIQIVQKFLISDKTYLKEAFQYTSN